MAKTLLLALLASTIVAAFPASARKVETHDASSSFPYIYATRKNQNASFPVIEYIAPTGQKNLDNDKPPFLYRQNQGYRIVEFYGHWCATCKSFKPHFIHFAQRVQELAAQQNETVAIYSISCHPNRKLCRKQTAQGYPIIRLLKPGATIGEDLKHTEVNPVKALEKMGMHMDMTEVEDNWDVSDADESDIYTKWQRMLDKAFGMQAQAAVPYHRRTREELRDDIHLSFDFAMRDGVFSSNDPLTEKASGALKEWLKLLHKTLPAAWEAMHKLLDQLLRDFNYISKHEAYLNGILDQFPPENTVWSPACSHGDPDAGYTCGLWELFHAMTVGVVDYNLLNTESRRIATENAAHTLRDYIEHFFGCVDCRNNFLSMFDSCGHDRCNRLQKDANGLAKDKKKGWAQLPLWLFEVHNAVNVRLMKEKAERDKREPTVQDEIDVLWPPKRDCLLCWASSGEDGPVTWNQTNVQQWISLEYGQRDAASAKLRKDMQVMAAATGKKANRGKARIEISSASALLAFGIVFVLGAKVRRRRVTGRHKKVEEDIAIALSPSSPVQRRGTISKASTNASELRYF